MTTRTKLPASCVDCSMKLTRANRASVVDLAGDDYNNMCTTCYTYASWENTHNDEGHDADNIDPACPVCAHMFDDSDDEVEWVDDEDGHYDVIDLPKRKNMSHAECTHERTAKGRAACRASHKK
jgi:hypothetical protein